MVAWSFPHRIAIKRGHTLASLKMQTETVEVIITGLVWGYEYISEGQIHRYIN